MKNKTLDIVLITLIVIIFTGYFIALRITIEREMLDQLTLVEQYARNEKWEQALEATKDIKNSWNSKKHLIMFNFAEAEFAVFENHLNYIIGGAEGKQLDTTLGNILAAKDLWENAKKIVPEP